MRAGGPISRPRAEYREGSERRRLAAEGVLTRFGTIPAPAYRGPFNAMPNIQQQKKRVRTAAKQRLENLRYQSTAKTLAKRLQAAVQAGDEKQVEPSTASSSAGSTARRPGAPCTGTLRHAARRRPRASFQPVSAS